MTPDIIAQAVAEDEKHRDCETASCRLTIGETFLSDVAYECQRVQIRRRILSALVDEREHAEAGWALARQINTDWLPANQRLGEQLTEAQDAIGDILCKAYKFDDKPHQLFSAIRKVALRYADDAERDEIVRLMDIEYGRPRSGTSNA